MVFRCPPSPMALDASGRVNEDTIQIKQHRIAFEVRHERRVARTWARPAYSVRTLSAHSTKPTNAAGAEKVAFLPTRSASRTPRAREPAPQTCIGTLWSITFARAPERGAHPTGTTEPATTARIRETASPRRKIWTS